MTRHARTAPPAHRGRRALVTVALLAVLGVAGVLLAQQLRTPPDAQALPTPTETVVTPSPTPTPTPTPDPDATFTIVAGGDVLTHAPVNASATTGGVIDFSPLLAGLDAWVAGADLALCHMEVPVAPAGTPPSGYPLFGAPAEIARDLAEQGWDGCSTASNHSVDRGFAGVTATLDTFDAAGLGHVGTARSAVEAEQPQTYLLQRDGQELTVAHLAATYGTNGMPVGTDTPWSVSLIDTDRLVAQATAARAAGADLVLVSIHAGNEYVTAPTDQQVQVATALAASGVVDLVIGHHAHVPQPVELLPGGPDGTGMWVAYGLGNMVANQGSHCCVAASDSGLLLTAHVVSPGAFDAEGRAAGPARVTGVEWTPITVDRTGGHRVHVLAEIPGGTATLTAAEVATRLERVRGASGTAAPERSTPTEATGPAPTRVPRAR